MRRRKSAPQRPVLETPSAPPGLVTAPFVGRSAELAALAAAVLRSPLTVVTGPAGVGKTALARELVRLEAPKAEWQAVAHVRCEEGDLACAVIARAERGLDVVPGTLEEALGQTRRLLVLDEVHRLAPESAAELLDRLSAAARAGRVLALTRDVLPLHRDEGRRIDVALTGLVVDDARALWAQLESVFGATPAGAVDEAVRASAGVPLALRREYASALAGKKAWDVAALPEVQRRVLQAASILRQPAVQASLLALASGADAAAVSAAEHELVRRQLLEPLSDGRLDVHDSVRAAALATLGEPERLALEAAAALLHDEAPGRGSPVGLADPVDRLREAVRHLIAAGRRDEAGQRLVRAEAILSRRGAGGEALSLAQQLDPDDAALRALRARILARLGRVAEAREALIALDPDEPRVGLLIVELTLAAGDPVGARACLERLIDHIQPEVRALALAALARVEVERGAFEEARRAARAAVEAARRVDARSPLVRHAELRLLVAQIEERTGRYGSARQAVGRVVTATSPAGAAEAGAAAVMAACLAEEDRLEEATAELGHAERIAREHDELALADEVRRRRAALLKRSGRLVEAETLLRDLAAAAWRRGDELAALRAEAELALVLCARGRAGEAGRIAASVETTAIERSLLTVAAEARLARVLADLDDLRAADAAERAASLTADAAASEKVRARALLALRRAQAWLGAEEPPAAQPQSVEEALAAAEAALARGDAAAALEAARDAAQRAERAGRRAELARALAVAARLHVARGERALADSAMSRALAEGAEGGVDRAVVRALLVKAAMARDDGELPAARAAAADALTVARAAGLLVEQQVAAAAAELLSREVDDGVSAGRLEAIRRATSATLSEAARTAAERMLADLGLTAGRPFRIVSAEGTGAFVAEIDPTLLKLDKRALVIDGGRELVLRTGKPVADLRKRSLLKRLLFLFAGAPGRSFTKEDIVQKVWGVEYHPLRHDAALFTNIMRLRRLLGPGGEKILRVSEQGYRLVPPADYLYVERLAPAP